MNQESRTTSYSLKNNLDLTLSNFPSSVRRQGKPTAFSLPSRNNTKRNANLPLSSIMANTFSGNAEQTAFAAFKVLPIDPTRIRRASSSASGLYADASDELNGASSCREAVDLIVDSIYRGCEDAGSTHSNFVTSEDVVRRVSYSTLNVCLKLSFCETVSLKHNARQACTRKWNMGSSVCYGWVVSGHHQSHDKRYPHCTCASILAIFNAMESVKSPIAS